MPFFLWLSWNFLYIFGFPKLDSDIQSMVFWCLSCLEFAEPHESVDSCLSFIFSDVPLVPSFCPLLLGLIFGRDLPADTGAERQSFGAEFH